MTKCIGMYLIAALAALGIAACGGAGTAASATSAPAETSIAGQTKEAVKKDGLILPAKKAPEETTAPAEPLDLTGLWVQQEHEADTYMVADIRDDGKIGVFFYVENDTPWTYWVGTYDAPETDAEPYTWKSINTYAGNGLLASGADDKDFTYKDGILRFKVTIQGETGELYLERGDWDTSVIPEEVYAEKVAAEDVQAAVSGEFLEITDSGWYLSSGEYLKYYVKLRNTSKDTIIEFPSFRITARDQDGVLLGTEDQTLSKLYPGQEFVYGSQAFSVEEIPAAVEFEPLPPSDYNLKKAGTAPDYIPLEVINDKMRSEKYVGEISNLNDYAIDMVCVGIISWDADGNVIDVSSTFVNDIPANGSAPFEISFWGRGNGEAAKYEAFANQW